MTDLTTIQPAWLQSEEVQRIFTAFSDRGFVTRAVGGAVRDAVLMPDRPVTAADIDLATTARPEQTIAVAEAVGFKAIPTGIAHGTVTLVGAHDAYEVTTLRSDVSTDGRHADVAFTEDWIADAERRDFTINAIYCEADGRLHDPLGGISDLAARRLTFVGHADRRIAEDHLRILRLYRFVAQIPKVSVKASDLEATSRAYKSLRRLSAERVRTEFLKVLANVEGPRAVQLLRDYGLLSELTPTVPWLQRYRRADRLVKALSEIDAHRLIVSSGFDDRGFEIFKLAALTVSSLQTASALQNRLRLSRAERHTLEIAATYGFGQPLWIFDEAQRRKVRFTLPADDFMTALFSQAAQWMPEGQDAQDVYDALHATLSWTPPTFPLTGADLIEIGAPKGPIVGEVLKTLTHRWMDAGFEADREALLIDAEKLLNKTVTGSDNL
ncbi:MAG: CCA tRNA nucleotidyltransferase [Pseudomonadota bacterium]